MRFDVHKEASQLCILTAEGPVFEQRIRTRRDRFAAVLGARAHARRSLPRLALPAPLRATVTPLLALFAPLNAQIAELNDHFAALAAEEAILTRLCTVPNIGPLTAATFRATLDHVDRF